MLLHARSPFAHSIGTAASHHLLRAMALANRGQKQLFNRGPMPMVRLFGEPLSTGFWLLLGEVFRGDGEVQVLAAGKVEGSDAEQLAAGIEQAATRRAVADRRRGLHQLRALVRALG